jgi:hypothetical protein
LYPKRPSAGADSWPGSLAGGGAKNEGAIEATEPVRGAVATIGAPGGTAVFGEAPTVRGLPPAPLPITVIGFAVNVRWQFEQRTGLLTLASEIACRW